MNGAPRTGEQAAIKDVDWGHRAMSHALDSRNGLDLHPHEDAPPESSSPASVAFGSLLLSVVAEVAQGTSTSDVASRMAEVFVRRLGARVARVYLGEGESSPLRLIAFHGAAAEDPSHTFASGHADVHAARAAHSGLMLLTHSVVTTARSHGEAFGQAGEVSVAFPLFAATVTVGAVCAVFERFPHPQRRELRTLRYSLGALLGRARLEEEVVRLTQDVRRHYDGVALVARDLRLPLSTMLMVTSLLARHVEPRHRSIAARLSRSMLSFERMVSDLSDVSLLVSGKVTLRFAPVDLGDLVRGAAAAHPHGGVVRVQEDVPHVNADARRIEEVMGHLLRNAAKHGLPACVPRIEVARRDRTVTVAVTNDGAPIPEDERGRVFDPYYRSRAREPMTEGLGLGLYVCRRLVAEHGGDIWTDGDAGCTRFTFSLPIPPPTPDDSGVRPAASQKV